MDPADADWNGVANGVGYWCWRLLSQILERQTRRQGAEFEHGVRHSEPHYQPVQR